MGAIFAQIFPIDIPPATAFVGAGFIAGMLATLYKARGLTSAYLGNQIAIHALLAASVIGIAAGSLLGCEVRPRGLWTDLFVIGITAALLLVSSRFLGIAYRAIRQWI